MSLLPQIVQRHFATKVRWLKGSLNNWISHPFLPFCSCFSVTSSLVISIFVSVSVGLSTTVDPRQVQDGADSGEKAPVVAEEDRHCCAPVILVVVVNAMDSSTQKPEKTVTANKTATQKLILKEDTEDMMFCSVV